MFRQNLWRSGAARIERLTLQGQLQHVKTESRFNRGLPTHVPFGTVKVR